ncbi:MAG TPA: transposase [Thermoleophilaceae bacterium]|jgi:transposase|nr:transposase [Thermoleophilaceae bacterium]
MAQNFIACGREQELLLPPSLREWLPEGHFAWFLLDAVEEMDLSAFYAAYRLDGLGRPAHDPALMVAVLLYGYARGVRSSRKIERALVEDVAFRVIAANQVPDHTTIARFRRRHEAALGGLFGEVLALCAEAGLVEVGVVAIDGTKLHANACKDQNLGYEQIAREILAEADAVDREEDERYGEGQRGDVLPPEFRSSHGRRGWIREAKQRLEERREVEARPIPNSRPERLRECRRRLEEELAVERRAVERQDEVWAARVAAGKQPKARPPKPYLPPERPPGEINVSDPDSRRLKGPRGYLQGYNAQAAVSDGQVVIAAEVNADAPDFGHLEPMVSAAQDELGRAGVSDTPGVVVADAGYWNQEHMEAVVNRGIQVLVRPDAAKRRGPRPGWEGGLYTFMRRVLSTEQGGRLYRQRQAMIEPVFADTKFNRRIDRFLRRGRAAARSEWRLITATHNLLKLHRHQLRAAAA